MHRYIKLPILAVSLALVATGAQAGAFATATADRALATTANAGIAPIQAMSVVQDEAPNGWNAVQVNYSDGQFFQNGNQWIERNPRGTYYFVETHRDEWSVYLLDSGRNARIQLDLWQKKIYYSDTNTARTPIYAITGASSGGRVIQY